MPGLPFDVWSLTLVSVVVLAGLFFATTLFFGGGPGYQRVDGKWAWVSYDESAGRRIKHMDVDPATVEVLRDQYAADQQHVYFEGRVIEGALPQSFSIIDGQYSKDREHVYYQDHRVHGADPHSFEILGFPYARDATEAYCGTVPLGVADPSAFEVTREDGMITTTTLKHLRERAPALADSLRTRGISPEDQVVIASTFTSKPAEAQAGDRRFEGCQQVP